MNNFNHKNMDEYVDNQQETSNLPNVELVNTIDINLNSYVLWMSVFPC